MAERAITESWQVDVSGQIYEANFEELIQWIDEGALLPTDKVRRGNLRWAEASKVPRLASYFQAKTKRPVKAAVPAPPPANLPASKLVYDAAPPSGPQVLDTNIIQNKNECCVHAGAEPVFLCTGCANAFCKECPRTYSSTKICPACGGECKRIVELLETNENQTRRTAAISSGFGVSDLTAAFAHPFKYKTSLIVGAVMFMFFTLGQSASAIGGFAMLAGSVMCLLLANMLTFGVLSNTVENFSQGKTETNFMPDFDDFSFWDDVVHPFFLSIGVYITSFGVFIAFALIGLYFVIGSLTAQQMQTRTTIQKTPLSYTYDTRPAIEQSEQVKKMLPDIEKKNAERIRAQTEVANGGVPSGDTEEMVMQAQQVIDEHEKAKLEALAGKAPDPTESDFAKAVKGYTGLPAPLVVLTLIGLLWGLFYFPAACAVAGYTRSFSAVINPLVGLDTIRRMGFDYVRLLLMGLCIAVLLGVISSILDVVLSPMNLPTFGNLPAKAIGSMFSFYFSVVFSCVLGYALFKASDRLKLYK